MRKLLSAIISSPLRGRLCGILFALLATTTLWAQDFQVGDLFYNITSSSEPYTAEVVGADWRPITTANIPETVEYNGIIYTVTSIGKTAFAGRLTLTLVTIPNSVMSIGDYAFLQCSSITSINIPNSVISIGQGAFEYCSSLTSITIGNSVTSIGNSAFSNCSSLSSINIPNSVISIGDSAFEYCSSSTSITIGNSVISIGESAFEYCSSSTSITIGNSVTSIGKWAFRGCNFLTSVIWNAKHGIDFVEYNDNPFYIVRSQITSFEFGNNVEHIPAYLCYNMEALSSITIGENITSIGDDAFYGTAWSKNLPNGLVYVGKVLYEYVGEMPHNASIEIKDGITSIYNNAFARCTNLTSVTIPKSVTSIGQGAFKYCSSLTSITIPNSVTSIGDYAFQECTSLSSINLSKNIDFVGGSYAFYNTPWYNNLPIGMVYIGKVLYEYKGTMSSNTSIEIKEGTKSITSGAFSNQSGLISIQIPNSITYIGFAAFRKCTSLKSLTIPENVTTIEEYAFYECNALKTIYALPTMPPELVGYCTFDSKYIKDIIVSLSSFTDYKKQWSLYSDFITIDTSIDMSLSLLQRTQTTITIHANVGDLSEITKTGKHAVEWCIGETITSDANKIYFDEGMLNLETTITNLSPNTQYAFRVLYGIQDEAGVTYYINGETKTFTTSPVVLSEPTLQTTGQTYIEVQTSSAYGNATLVEEVVEVATSKYNTPEQRVNVAGRSNVIINNLMPDTKYYFRSVLTTQEAGTMQSEWYEATTEEITLATGDADGISNSSAFLHGTIDCDTMSRTEIGFEWKRSDAPSTVKPQRLLVVDRVDENLIFRLEGLSSDRYYDFRTFCLYNGKEYYGEWVGFLTSDKDILIPPSVQTREAEITDLGVLMKGFVVAGTEVILQRGFECWREESDQVATTVAEGAIMSSYIPEAWSYTTYKYRAYAKTPAGTTYGETLEVTTEYIATNITDIIVNASSNSAQVTWTMVEQADYYILTLYSDESMTEVIGVYTVDKNGNVTQKRVASATQSLVTCELTELLPETSYYFAVKAYNNNDQMVAEENGSFATTVVPTAVENAHSQSPMTNCKKILRDGQLLILRDGKTYNVMGVIVE